MTLYEIELWHNKSVHTEPRVARHFEIKVVRRDPVTSNVMPNRRAFDETG